MTNDTVNKEPKWRHRGRELTTGYHPTTYGRNESVTSIRRRPESQRSRSEISDSRLTQSQ